MYETTSGVMNQLQIFLDPVLWCQSFLVNPKDGKPFIPYPYQARILRHPAMNKMLRLGRRCGKTQTMAIHMLWQCAIRPDMITCLVVTPYERQVLELFDTLLALLNASPALRGSYTSTKHPFQIKFHNGNRINLMTAGTKSGAEGSAVRGQPADWIYFDEMDYLSDKDITAVISIRLRDPKAVGIWGSSTPTGRRASFYKYCNDKSAGFTEFHYTFYESPMWLNSSQEDRDQVEREIRAQYPDDISYQHEVLAEFGTEAVGVFHKEYLERARGYSVDEANINVENPRPIWDYFQRRDHKGFLTNELIAPPYKAIRTIGVDWDKKGAPTEIVVTEWCHWIKNSSGHDGMFRVIARAEIPRSEFTLTRAVSKIVELNQVFDPDWIYVDSGYGEMQVEQLKLYGKEHPETKLDQKVKAVAFGSKTDTRDPVSGEVIEKHTKPLMVNNAVHILDSDLLQLNNQDALLWRQLENYQIVGVSIYGQPKYTDKDEHALDALVLSLFAMTMEFPELSRLINRFHPSYRVSAVKNRHHYEDRILADYGRKNEKERETDPIELRDEKFKNCRNISWGSGSKSWLRRGRGGPPSRSQW